MNRKVFLWSTFAFSILVYIAVTWGMITWAVKDFQTGMQVESAFIIGGWLIITGGGGMTVYRVMRKFLELDK